MNLEFHEVGELTHFAGLTDLESLDLSGASSHAVILDSDTDFSSLSGMPKLNRLTLFNNEISDVSGLVEALEVHNSVTYLHLQGNGIANVDPLVDLVNLRTLVLSYNQIEDVGALAALTNLAELSLQHNRITDVSALSVFDPDEMNYIYLHEQRVDQPDAAVGDIIWNPVTGLSGAQVQVTSNDGGFTPVGTQSWMFTIDGAKTLTWETANPYDSSPFSGTITQQVHPRTIVVPEIPEIDTCVDGESVVVTDPAGPEGVVYQSEVIDNGDGTFTVVARAMPSTDAGVVFNLVDLPEGWEHTGDGILEWSTTVTPDCEEPVEVVEPGEPTVETCVDGESVVVTDPAGPEGVEYQSRIIDNEDGSFTVVTLAQARAQDGVMFDLEAPPAGWEHIGDGILEWSTTVIPDCDSAGPVPSEPEDEDRPEATPSGPSLPPTGVDAAGIGLTGVIAIALGAMLLVVRDRRRLQRR